MKQRSQLFYAEMKIGILFSHMPNVIGKSLLEISMAVSMTEFSTITLIDESWPNLPATELSSA
jgi:hypothetical protein